MPAQNETSTILVGYGQYGLEALRAFLSSSAARGVLDWAEVAGGAGPHERRLKDLALIWLPDSVEGERAASGGANNVFVDLKRDLFRQIQGVPNSGRDHDAFSDVLMRVANDLLAVGAQMDGRPLRPTRLDIMVLAQPRESGDLGRLRTTMDRAMDSLGNNPELRSRGQGGHRLSMVQMLDFDNYWDRSPRAVELRRALRDSLEHWEQRYQMKQPSFSRTYVMDGHASGRGPWNADARREEVVLLLQFMLFEGQRGGDLRTLFARAQDRASPVAAIGIRQLVRSSGLMGRLAAARFGTGWMEYLSNPHGQNRTARPEWEAFKDKLRRWQPGSLEQMVEGSNARQHAEASLEELADQLATRDHRHESWAEQAAEACLAKYRSLKQELTGWASRTVRELDDDELKELTGMVEQEVERALHHPRKPMGLGEVIHDLEQIRGELKPAGLPEPSEADQPAALRAHFHDIQEAHERFVAEQITPGGTTRLWPLLAIVITAGATPLLSTYLSSMPEPDPTATTRRALVEAAGWLAEPLHCGLLMLPLLIAIGVLWVQRGITFRVRRAHQFWTDPERGRFVDAVRAVMEPGGLLRGMYDQAVDASVREAQWRVVSEVDRTLELVLARLATRHREINWLRQQLVSFQNESGLDDISLSQPGPLFGRNAGSVRYQVERTEDFQKMIKFFPAIEERFRELQGAERPFKDWKEEFSPAFLYPLVFLDQLGKRFTDPYEQERARQDDGPMHERHAADFEAFLAHYGRFSTGFSWPQEIKVPDHRLWAVVPERWHRHRSIRDALTGVYALENIISGVNPERAYLVHMDLGIKPEHMVEEAR